MKKIIYLVTCYLLLVTGLPSTHALWSNSDTIPLSHQKITLEKNENEVFVERILTLTPEGKDSWQGFFALPKNSKDIKIFLNSDNLNFTKKENNQRLPLLFEQAQEKQDSRFFRLGDPTFPILIQTEEQEIAEESIVKFTYTIPLQEEQSWKYIALFLNDNITAKKTELFIKQPENEYFLNNLPDPTDSYKNTENNIRNVYITYQDKSFENLLFAWNKEPAALKKSYKDFTYIARPGEQKNFPPENITILIDQSGSMETGKWQKTIDITRHLLNEIWPDKKIRLGFFNDKLSWNTLDDEKKPIYQENNFEWRQHLLSVMNTSRPLGKTDLKKTLEEANKDPLPEDHALILITDEAPPADALEFNQTFVFGFQDEEETLQQWKDSGAIIQNLFSTQAAFLERTEVEDKISGWALPVKKDETLLPSDMTEVFPKVSNIQKSSPYFIGRTMAGTNKNPFSFIPRQWGLYKLQDLKSQEQTQDIIAAQDSVSVVFGIDKETQTPVPTINDTPIYENETYDYHERKNQNTELFIAPFSEVQKELFVNFPEQTAQGFGHGENTSFCTDIRCIKLTEDGETEITPFILAYWKERDKNHWARAFVEPMVKNGEYPIANNGALELDKPITRGDFANMLYNQIATYRWRIGTPLEFNDLPEDHSAYESITWFSQHKIIQGYEDQTAKPDGNITRAEAVKILLASDAYKTKEGEEKVFEDTEGWVIPWVNEAARQEIIKGYDRNNKKYFEPHKPLTKGQAAKLVTKFAE